MVRRHTRPRTRAASQVNHESVHLMGFVAFLVSMAEPDRAGGRRRGRHRTTQSTDGGTAAHASGAGVSPRLADPWSSGDAEGARSPPCTGSSAVLRVTLGDRCMDSLPLCDSPLFRKTGKRAKSSPKSASSGVLREVGMRSKTLHSLSMGLGAESVSTRSLPYLILAYWWFGDKVRTRDCFKSGWRPLVD